MGVFCNLMYSGGWMEIECEEIDGECNWALVRATVNVLRDPLSLQIEFKPLPLARSTTSGSTDPRTPSTVSLFEEFVPLGYRQQLSAGVQNKRTLDSFFSLGKTKQWRQAVALNGRPYVVGHLLRSLNSREAEFEGLLRGNNSSTKVIPLGHDGPVKRDITHRGTSWLFTEPFIEAYSTRDLFSLVCCAARGSYTLSVYPSHPNRHPNKHPRHRKRK